eukprot:3921316-Rhodomonas_salina.1
MGCEAERSLAIVARRGLDRNQRVCQQHAEQGSHDEGVYFHPNPSAVAFKLAALRMMFVEVSVCKTTKGCLRPAGMPGKEEGQKCQMKTPLGLLLLS